MQQIVSVRPRQEWRAIQLLLGDAAVGMHRGLNVEELAIVAQKVTGRCAANTQRLFQDRFEHRGEVASRGVDDAEHLGGRGFSGKRLVALGGTLGKFAPKIGDRLFETSQSAVGRRAHFATSLAVLPDRSYPIIDRSIGSCERWTSR